ncbi:sensor histidine kinase [Paenibacillus chitinolyticus]|uniref:sensor histidine kinase n=1 Tax=Paenibacillus chitinolyticus TaxID=79263 RepID=UPI003D001FE0
MSIRARLLASFTLLLVATVLLFTAAAFIVTTAVTGDVRGISSFYNVHLRLKPLTTEQETLFLDLKHLAKTKPEELLVPDIYKEYDFQLKVAKASLLIRKGSGSAFISPALAENQPEAVLPPYEAENVHMRSTLQTGKNFFGYAKYDFRFADGEQGRLFVFREVSPFAVLMSKLLPLFVSVLFLLLVGSNIYIYLFLTRRMIRPLNLLRASATRIQRGDLRFRIEPGEDEIGQVSAAFEEMRGKLQESEELQKQYENNRKELIANISHDLKTPLSAIRGYVEGIRDGVADTPDKLESYVDIIYSKAEEMDHLIEELFLYSRLDLNKVPFALQEVDLTRFVADVVYELRFELEKEGVGLETDGHSTGPLYVRIDPMHMKRVVNNVVGNSLKFMEGPQKTIAFDLRRDGGAAVLEITDTGPGIDPAALPHVFDRFYRAETSRNRESGGQGLGLAIAQQIVDNHGGSIYAENASESVSTRHPQTGTRIVIRLPLLKGNHTDEKNSDH